MIKKNDVAQLAMSGVIDAVGNLPASIAGHFGHVRLAAPGELVLGEAASVTKVTVFFQVIGARNSTY